MPNAKGNDHDVRDLGLAAAGRKPNEWADPQMPVLRIIPERLAKDKPLNGQRHGACTNITSANST